MANDNPFGECIGDEHQGAIEWKPYAKGLDAEFADGKRRGLLVCSVCLNTIDYAVVEPQGSRRMR